MDQQSLSLNRENFFGDDLHGIIAKFSQSSGRSSRTWHMFHNPVMAGFPCEYRNHLHDSEGEIPWSFDQWESDPY
jgi:hypothetical protein